MKIPYWGCLPSRWSPSRACRGAPFGCCCQVKHRPIIHAPWHSMHFSHLSEAKEGSNLNSSNNLASLTSSSGFFNFRGQKPIYQHSTSSITFSGKLQQVKKSEQALPPAHELVCAKNPDTISLTHSNSLLRDASEGITNSIPATVSVLTQASLPLPYIPQVTKRIVVAWLFMLISHIYGGVL